jgi:AraC-like DNA-binding protein
MRAQFEDVHWTGHESFLVRTFDLPRFTVPWHFHPEPELTLILEGSGDRCVGDHLGSFRAGDLVLLAGNLPHYWHSHAHAAPSKAKQSRERARAVVVHLREEYFGGSLLSLPEASSWKKLLDRAHRGLAFEGKTASHASKELERLPEKEGSRQLLALLGILQTLCDGAADDTLPLAGEHYLPACDDHAAERVRRVYQFIYAHLAEPIGLDDLARAAGMSSAAFCRYCKRVTGRSPTRLLSELRITQACKLLTDTSKSVSEIAFASGFQSISNFNRVFQQIKDTSPQVFRRQHARTH